MDIYAIPCQDAVTDHSVEHTRQQCYIEEKKKKKMSQSLCFC